MVKTIFTKCKSLDTFLNIMKSKKEKKNSRNISFFKKTQKTNLSRDYYFSCNDLKKPLRFENEELEQSQEYIYINGNI